METEVQQPFGNIQRRGAVHLVVRAVVDEAVEDEFVLAHRGNGQLVGVFQALLDIVGTQHRQFAGQLDVLLSKGQDVGISPEDNPEIAQESRHLTGRLLGRTHHLEGTIRGTDHLRNRDDLCQTGCHTHRTAAGTASAMRRREGLVQVQVHDVKAHVSRTDHTQHRVHIGPVVIEQAAAGVYQRGDLHNLLLEETEGVRVGHHDAGDGIVQQGFQVVHIHQTFRRGFDHHHLQAANGRTRGIGTVGAVRDDDARALDIAAQQVVLPHDHQTGQFTVRTRTGVEGKEGHARNGRQGLVHLVINLQGALDRAGGLQRMQALETGHGGDFFVDLGVVLHGTAAQRIETGVHAEVHLRKIGIMAHHIHLRHLRQGGRGAATKPGRKRIGPLVPRIRRKRIAGPSLPGKLEYQFIVIFHGYTSFTASTRASISALVRFSVTQKLT